MNAATIRLVLMVSCAHAMVHVYELSFPSVEQLVAEQYHVSEETTGLLGSCWRLPFGLGALAAGWFSDRLGSKPMLLVYLAGCAVASWLAWIAPSLAWIFVSMFAMGTFASIYHPAGLALISHETNAINRPLALGYHGIFGSLGIAAAPFLAAVVLFLGATWQQYYLMLAVPGALLAVLMSSKLKVHKDHPPEEQDPDAWAHDASQEHQPSRWEAFTVLLGAGAVFGFIYSAQMNFLPRYLGESKLALGGLPAATVRNFLAGGVLLVGMLGQYLAARWARPGKLERQLMWIMLGNVPFLAWMAVAEGANRIWAAACFALVHFMHQPVYNSLVADYVPRSRRSLGFGLSNTLTFGIGSMGASFAGYARKSYGTLANYATLAILACIASALAVVLWRIGKRNLIQAKAL